MKGTIFKVFSSNAVGAAFGFLTTLVLSRTLNVDEFGRFSLLLSIASILQILVTFGFNNAVIIKANKDKGIVENPLFLPHSVFFPFCKISILIFLIPAVLLVGWYYACSTEEIFFLLLTSISLGLITYVLATQQAKEEWNRFSILNIMNNVLKLFFAGVFVLTSYSLTTPKYPMLIHIFIFFAMVSFVVVLYWSGQTKDFFLYRFNKAVFFDKSYWNLVIPIGITNIIIVFAMRIDILLIEHYLGVQALGIYAVALSLVVVFPLLTSTLMSVYLVKVSSDQNHSKNLHSLFYQQKKFILPIVVVGVLVARLSHVIIPWLFGIKYADAAGIFNILLVAYMGSIIFTPIESHYYAHQPKLVMYLKALQLVIIVALSIVLVPVLQLSAIALAIVASRLIGWGYLGIISWKRIKNV